MFIRGGNTRKEKGRESITEDDYVNQYTTDSSDGEEIENDDSDADSDVMEKLEISLKKNVRSIKDMWHKNYSAFLKRFQPEIRDENYFVEPSNFKTYPWIVIKYVELAKYLRGVIKTETYSNGIIAIICLAGLNVGIQTYPVDKETFEGLDLAILICFIVEAGIKIISEGLQPWHYFTGVEWRWNCFDFLIIILSLDFMSSIFGGGYGQSLRLVRLGKSYKINPK